jgi:hypothetical protein
MLRRIVIVSAAFNRGDRPMRNAVLAAAVFAALAAPASAGGLSPDVPGGHPSLGSGSGRWSLCRAHLEKQGYPYSYLRKRSSRGILSACSRELWRKHHRVV